MVSAAAARAAPEREEVALEERRHAECPEPAEAEGLVEGAALEEQPRRVVVGAPFVAVVHHHDVHGAEHAREDERCGQRHERERHETRAPRAGQLACRGHEERDARREEQQAGAAREGAGRHRPAGGRREEREPRAAGDGERQARLASTHEPETPVPVAHARGDDREDRESAGNGKEHGLPRLSTAFAPC